MKLSMTTALALLLGTGCSFAPRTYVFQTPRPRDEALDLLARRLEQEGHKVSSIDRHTAELVTYWEKASSELRDDGSDPATAVFVRYHIELQTVEVDHKVKVSAELQRCAADTFTVTASEVVGGCQDIGRAPAGMKATLDDLGRRLSAQLSSPAAPANTALASAACASQN
jgi:hypothetical protein